MTLMEGQSQLMLFTATCGFGASQLMLPGVVVAAAAVVTVAAQSRAERTAAAARRLVRNIGDSKGLRIRWTCCARRAARNVLSALALGGAGAPPFR